MHSEVSPFVSVIVVSYNSSRFVLETLESIKNQTYQNIELIISDDCSSDDTITIIKKWIEQNNKRFVRIDIIEVEKNTGIPENANRGLNAAKGDWIKFIAGDDILLKDCIEKNLEYINENNGAKVIFSQPLIKTQNNDSNLEKKLTSHYANVDYFFDLTPKSQFIYLISFKPKLCPPTFFVHRETLKDIGGFNPTFISEDKFIYLQFTFNNIKLYFLPIPTVIYRIHTESESLRYKGTKNYTRWFLETFNIRSFFVDKIKRKIPFVILLDYYFKSHVGLFAIKYGGNRKFSKFFLNKSIVPNFIRHFIIKRIDAKG